MSGIHIRPAQPADADAIASIYNHYILNSNVTFDTVPKSVEDRVEWLAGHGPKHPVVVAEIDAVVVAWGSISPWATRPAWGRTVEVSIYVSPTHTRLGIGPMLMEELAVRAKAAGHHALMSQIVGDNEPSLRLGERHGFAEVGRLREVGEKFGRWHDVVILERLI